MSKFRELADSYASDKGYAQMDYLLALVSYANKTIIEREMHSPIFINKMNQIFCDDIASAFKGLTFVWPQVWRVAVSSGVLPKVADKIYDTHILQAQHACTIQKLLDLNAGLFLAYANAVEEAKTEARYSRLVQKCCDFVHEHIYEAITIQEIADYLNISESYISHLFRDETGVALITYIREEKIAIAKLLLMDSTRSVNDIMCQLGYCSQSYFTRIFKEHTGITPGKYRKIKDKAATSEEETATFENVAGGGETLNRESWYIRAETFGQKKGLEMQQFFLGCIRRGKPEVVEEQLRDPVYLQEMGALFDHNKTFAIEALTCVWPQAIHVAAEGGVSVDDSTAYMSGYMSQLYSALTVDEIMELNRDFFVGLARMVKNI